MEKVKWWALKEEWRRKQGTKEAEITLVKIFNQYRNQTDKFKLGDKIIVKVEFIVNEEVIEPHFGVAIFREDGVYCYGPNTLFDEKKIEKLKIGKGWFSIEFRDVNLMPGDYRFSVAIWDKKEVLAYSYHPGFYRVKIIGFKNTGELLNLSHKWKLHNHRYITKSCHLTKDFNLHFLENRWRERYSTQDVEIISVKFLDKVGNLKDSFETERDINIKTTLKVNRDRKNLCLWVGIFRKDGVYCCGAWKRLTDGEETVYLIYPKLSLLTGEYRVSVGVLGENNQTPLAFHHGIYPFTVFFKRRDHGTLYLDHKWKWKLP